MKNADNLTASEQAVKYIISVWDEVTAKTWRERPDHVQQMFLIAEEELKNKKS
jgi:hypothetical protein